MEYEKKGGSILACVCFAKSGLLLDVVDLGAKVLPTSQILSCKISQINRLAADVIQVLLRLPSASEFSFSRLIC